MESIMTAPGVIKSATRIYVTPEDVSALMGCRRSMAYEMIKKINNDAKKRGKHTFPSGKANKYLFFNKSFGQVFKNLL